jgi:hypothetical protein
VAVARRCVGLAYSPRIARMLTLVSPSAALLPLDDSPRASWADNDSNFDFGGQEEGPYAREHNRQEDPHAQGPHAQEHSRQEDTHAQKYMSTRPKASGQSIRAPGSSIVSTSGVNDAVLTKVREEEGRGSGISKQVEAD